jgi:cell division protein FtsI (penicillin-binding protein 3)
MSELRRIVHVPAKISEPKRPSPEQSIYLDVGKKNALEVRRSRLVIITAMFIVGFLALGVRLVELTLFSSDRQVRVARPMAVVDDVQFRRSIVDRNGNVIATDLGTVSLYADARAIIDADAVTKSLMKVLPSLNAEKVHFKLSSGRPFVWIKRDLTPQQHASVHSLGIPGLHFRADRRRVYPNGALVSQVVGYVGTDNVGLAGIEKSLDEELLSVDEVEPLKLTFDLRVQHVLRQELIGAIQEFSALAASGLIMDVNSGEVLAMVSLPDFDPNEFGSALANEQFNRATLGVYEMGSTFKAFNTAMAIDAQVVGLEDRFDARKPYETGGRVIRDFHGENRWLTVSEVFMHSSNIGSAKIAHRAGVEVQKEFLQRLGLFGRSPVELPEVGAPILPAQWGPTETATVSYGHGISVSPLQTATAIASLVNGGTYFEPTLVLRDEEERQSGRRVVSELTSRQMRRLMRMVVTEGTGKNAEVAGFSVAGKTGTAEKAVNGRYDRKALITSFVGVFPSESPRYLVLVVLDEPKGNKATHGFATAGWNAAPVVGRVVERAALVLGVRPSEDQDPLGETQLAAYRR